MHHTVRLFAKLLEERVTPDNTPHNMSGSNLYQNWNNAALIIANDDWSGVLSVVGYLGDDTFGEGVDPQSVVTPYTTIDVIANQGFGTALTTGGVAEFDALGMIALQPDATADAVNLVVSINTTDRANIVVSYNLRDLDGTMDNAIQPVALQYRVGNSGNFVNVPGGFVADATLGPNSTGKVTPVSATLPSAADNQSLVQVRIITTNAVGNDEWVAVDDLVLGTKEFADNSYTTNIQRYPAVGLDANGDAFVTWTSYGQDGSGYGIYGQRFDAAGNKIGAEIPVNTFTTDWQSRPSVAVDADGDAFVVWHSANQDGDSYGIYGQRFNASGAKVGGEIRINTYTTNSQRFPSVAVDANGDAFVTWTSYGQDGSGNGIYGQRFDPSGIKVGGEFQINTFTNDQQDNASVAIDSVGDALVTWESLGQDGSGPGIFGQRFNASGAKVGSEFQVNTYATNNQRFPTVAMDADGDTVTIWASKYQDGSGYGIYGQRFNASGVKVGGEFQINTFNSGDQNFPSVAIDADGDTWVTWMSLHQNGDAYEVFAQRFNTAGAKVGGEFQINTYTASSQQFPSVAMDTNGDVVVAWESSGQDGSSRGVYGQRFRAPSPPAKFSSIQVNDGSAQRSMVTSLRITFDSPVNYVGNPAAAFSLANQSTGSPTILSAVVDASGTAVSLAFTGGSVNFNSLADGRFTLNIFASQFTGSGFDGNGDGIAGDNFELIGTPANGLFRLFGDADGNGSVNSTDFAAFRTFFGIGPSMFDFDNDGQTNAGDFAEFRTRFGLMI
jgi:hypothetical protein